MTPEQFAELTGIFEEALQRPPAEHAVFVRARTSDQEIIARLEQMLRSESAGSPLDVPALGRGFHVADPGAIEHRLIDDVESSGRFRVLSKLGEGGFGAVYRAEQLGPVRRELALKVIKLGMDTRRVVSRFESERQTLAVLDHPGIAKVYEAGALPSGRPYFAMELAAGEPITSYCASRRQSLPQRLRLFLSVCSAVQHAHQRGIIHRDLKPSNILVSDADHTAQPKVIDFGIARAIVASREDSASRGLLTQQDHPIGTPAYMSPEQAAADPDIDTRTDVYSLGVLLYELLTGTNPLHRLLKDNATPTQLVRAVQEDEIERPSQRAHALLQPGAGPPPPLTLPPARLRGDLDWIVSKALEKNRARRYETVSALADDISRHIDSQPIRAHPPTYTYLLVKFARRHKVVLAGIALATLALVGTSVGMIRSLAAEARARTEASTTREINTFLNDDLFAAASPDELGSEVKVRDVLDLASRGIDERFKEQPEVEAGVRLTLGSTYARLAEFAPAESHLRRAYELRRGLYGEIDPRTLAVVHELGELHTYVERYADAEALLRRAYEGRRQALGENHVDTLRSQHAMAVAMGEQGRYEQAEPIFIDALERGERFLGPNHIQTLIMLRGLAVLKQSMGHAGEALRLSEEAYTRSRATLGVRRLLTLLSMQDLSVNLLNHGENERALALLNEALEVSRSVRGPHHPGTLMTMANLAKAYVARADLSRAEEIYLQAIDAAKGSLPPGHTAIVRIQLGLAAVYDAQKRYDLSEPILLSAIQDFRARLGADHPLTQQCLAGIVQHYREAGRPGDADAWLSGAR